MTIYSIVMEFKDTLARIFLEKGLVWESYQLADFKAVAVEQQSRRTTAHVQHLSVEVIHMLKLIAEVVYAVVMNRIKTQKAVTINKYSQTDVSSSVGKTTPPIKKEQHMHEQTDIEGDTTPSPTISDIANTTIAPTTTPSDVLHPALRRSSRSSVLNRKPIVKTLPRTTAKKGDSPCKVVVANDSDKTMMMAESREGGEVKVWGTGGEGVPSVEQAASEGGGVSTPQRAGSKAASVGCRGKDGLRVAISNKTIKGGKAKNEDRAVEESCYSCSHPHETLTTKAVDDGEMSDFEPVGYVEQAKHSPKEEDPLLSDSEFNNFLSVGGDDAEEVKKEEEDRPQPQQQQTGQRSAPTEEAGSMGAMYEARGSGCYRCTVCGQETRDRSNMRKHVLRWHAGEQRHHCPVCSKAFTYPESLKFHMKVHVDPSSRAFERTPQGLYRCRQCGRECRNRSNIVKHVNRKHLKAGEKPYQCSLCSATFGYLCSLKRHELVHEGVRPYQCAQCHKRFFDPTSLRMHSRVHTDDRPYACQLCGNRFRQKEGLKGHMRSHTGDKPYVCDRCGMAFAAKRSLTRHIRVHTGERPYSCDQCVAAFADWTTLHNHKLIHRDTTHDTDQYDTTATADPKRTAPENKPYQCQFCGVQYSNTLSLKRHLRIHATSSKITKRSPRKLSKTLDGAGTQEESPALHLQYRPYMCEFCGERFKHLRGYTTHKKKHLNGTLLVRKTVSSNRPQVDRAGQGERQIGQDRTCVVSSRGAGQSSMDTPMSAFQPQLPPPPPPAVVNDVAVFETTLNSFPTPMHTVQIPDSDPSSVGHPGSLIHYTSEGMTQVIQYEDGSLGQLTTLVPHPPPPPPPSSLLQPVEDLLDSVVTVVFESADGNVVLESGQ